VLAGSYQDPGSSWTDDGKPGEVRGLRHRNEKETRPVPADPLLVAALRWHLEEFGVPSARAAAWAGHSVAVLHRVYAACLDGREDEARKRIDAFRRGPQ